MRLAFIGLGNIGGGAAANLVRAGHEMSVVDLDPDRVGLLTDLGARPAETIADACADADVAFTSLPGPPQITAIALGDDGLLGSLPRGAVWVELSTNDLDTARRFDEPARAAGVGLVDAPVSGGPEGATAGTLSIFVGGADDHVERVMPLLRTIGDRVDHLGPRGAGIVAKIAQVTLCYTQTVTLAEALLLGVKGGVEPERMLDLIRHSAGTSYVADTYGPEILAGTYDASFPIGHAAKDMRLAVDLARAVGAELPFLADVAALYADTEHEYGSGAAHLLAAQMLERRNQLILHETIDRNHPTQEGHAP